MQAEGGMIERYGVTDIQEPTDANSVPSTYVHKGKEEAEGRRKGKKETKNYGTCSSKLRRWR